MGQDLPEQRALDPPARGEIPAAPATAEDMVGGGVLLPGRLIRLVAVSVDMAVPVAVVGVLAFGGTLATGFPVLTTPWGLLASIVFVLGGAGALSATASWLSDGQSVGKALCGLEVRRTGSRSWDGQVSTLVWAFGRATIGYLVVDCFGIGGVGALTGRYRRAAHDLAFSSQVVHADPAAIEGATKIPRRLNLRIKEFERRRKLGVDRYAEMYGHVAGLVKWANKFMTGMASTFAAVGVWLFGSAAAGTAASAGTAGTVLVVTGGVAATGAVVWLGASGGTSADFPRSFEHGVLAMDVTSLVVTDVDPRDPEEAPTEESFVGVDISVANPLRDQGIDIPAGSFTLGRDELLAETGFFAQDTDALALEPTDRASSTIWFEFDSKPEISELVLTFEEGRGEQPSRLPLAGETPPAAVEVPIDPVTGGGAANHGVMLEIQTDGDPHLALNSELSPAGELVAGSCTSGAVGRVGRDHSLLVVPVTVTGNRPDTSSLPSLSFNAVNYGVPLQASADGSEVQICADHGDLDARREGAFVVVVPRGTAIVDIWSGCPCGGLITGNVVENEFFRVSIPTEAASDLF